MAILELVLVPVASSAESKVVDSEAVGWPLDAVALDRGLVSEASSVIVLQRTDSCVVLEPPGLTLIAVPVNNVVKEAVRLSVRAGSVSERKSSGAS